MVRRDPRLIIRGPVRHGDLYSPDIRAGDTIVIVDGVYHQRLALRHKEILRVLERGVRVVGAASIGALRAVELSSFGMVGVGRVYQWYRDGVFDGDDAVSVAHTDNASPIRMNVPLVNVYSALLAAQAAECLAADAAAEILTSLEAVYYPLRTSDRIMTVFSDLGGPTLSSWYRSRQAADPAAFDEKRADTLAAVDYARAAVDDPPMATPRESAELASGSAARIWSTEFELRWRNVFARDADEAPLRRRLAYQQIFAPEFPETWWEYLWLAYPATAECPDLRAHVLRVLGSAAADRLTGSQALDLVTDLIVPVPDLTDPWTVGHLLRCETDQDRATVADWCARTDTYLDRHPARSLQHIADEVCLRQFRGIWRVDGDLLSACARRGFASPRQAAAAFRPFVLGHLANVGASTGDGVPASV